MNFEAAIPHAVPDLDERALADALRARSPDAWTHVYDTHYDRIYRYALARTSDSVLAADLAATTFLEALKSAHTYTYHGRPVLAWLYTIARNIVAAHYQASRASQQERPGRRSGARSRLLAWARPQQDPVAGDEADPAQHVEHLDLQAALRSLPPEQREVLALRYFMGLPLVEVARVLGKQERKVYSLQARAIEGLRRALSAKS